MVRLRRETEGIERDPDRVPPRYLADTRLRELVEAPVLEAVETFVAGCGPRLLAVGVPAERVLAWLQEGRAVAVAEPEPERLDPLREAVVARGLSRRATLQPKQYGGVSFEASAFDGAVLLGELNRCRQPENAIWKCARELKIGGRLLASVTAAPSGEPPGAVARLLRTPGLGPVAGRVWDRARGGISGGDSWAVDLDRLLEEVARVVAVDEVHRTRVLLPAAAELVARLPAGLRGLASRALPAVARMDARLERQEPSAVLAWFIGAKRLGFGRVFMPGQNPE